MEYTIKKNRKSITVNYSNGASRRFQPRKKYHHKNMFYRDSGKSHSTTWFTSRFKKLLNPKWLDDTIAEVTSDCYNAIVNSAPVKTGAYRNHIVYRSPAINNFLKDKSRSIHVGSIYVKNEPLPKGHGGITYPNLARFLEFGTRSFEITGAGKKSKTKKGKPYGVKPQPHWIPNYEIYKQVLRERVRMELKKL